MEAVARPRRMSSTCRRLDTSPTSAPLGLHTGRTRRAAHDADERPVEDLDAELELRLCEASRQWLVPHRRDGHGAPPLATGTAEAHLANGKSADATYTRFLSSTRSGRWLQFWELSSAIPCRRSTCTSATVALRWGERRYACGALKLATNRRLLAGKDGDMSATGTLLRGATLVAGCAGRRRSGPFGVGAAERFVCHFGGATARLALLSAAPDRTHERSAGGHRRDGRHPQALLDRRRRALQSRQVPSCKAVLSRFGQEEI
eukprot:scaffold2085_cov263-Pinguiococcus_pyrenoidosus.AAC.8